jgi:peptidoglycan/xylan/chitin deacetylase (PgdA/CDA1 family)
MTGLSNADVVAQLGWTLQVIYNSTGGRLARYWRPPYGDTDARVNAIAREVFGLTTVIWNNEYAHFFFTVSCHWCLIPALVAKIGPSVHQGEPTSKLSKLTSNVGSRDLRLLASSSWSTSFPIKQCKPLWRPTHL